MEYKLDKPIKGTIGKVKYQSTIEWRNGKFISDEITAIGGKDAGPDPVSLLLSAVASSVLVMLRIYIDDKEWDIPEIAVNVNMFEEEKEGIITNVIDRDIVFLSKVSDEKKTKLLEVAKKCPITQILDGKIRTRTFVLRDSENEREVKYHNDKLTVVWRPDYCQHSLRCWKQLPTVFNPTVKKWINVEGASNEEIINQVKRCPSGALTYFTK